MQTICIWGKASEKEIMDDVRRFLEDQSLLRGIKRFGRITRFRIGVFASVVLVYYRSEGSFKICGPEKLIKEFTIYIKNKNTGIRLYTRSIILHEKSAEQYKRIVELLISLNEYRNKYYISRKIFIEGIAVAVFSGFLTRYLGYVYGIYDILLVMLLTYILYLSIPRPGILTGAGTVMPLMILQYRNRTKHIIDEINSLKVVLPMDHPLRRIIEMNIVEK